MTKYKAKEIESFLLVIDSFLSKKVRVVIIGGTAAALAYKVSRATQDIDTWTKTKDLESAHAKAQEKLGLKIPLEKSSFADVPYNFEKRLLQYKPNLFKNLDILIPDVIDLILMKMTRGYEHDLEAIQEMVKFKKVKLKQVAERYEKELRQSSIIKMTTLDLNFLAMVERCYGEKRVKEIASELGHKS